MSFHNSTCRHLIADWENVTVSESIINDLISNYGLQGDC